MRRGLFLLPLFAVLAACGVGAAPSSGGTAGGSASGAATPTPASAEPAATGAATPSPASPLASGQSSAAEPSAPAPQASSSRVAVAAPAGQVPMPGQVALPPEEEMKAIARPTAGGGTPPVPDACGLVPASDVAVLAPGQIGTSATTGSDAFSGSGCTWGALGDVRVLFLYVLAPGKVADPGSLFVPQTGAAPAPNPPGGNVWGTVEIGGSTGVGLTYGWTAGGKQVVLMALGPVDDAVRAAALNAARSVNTALGG